MSTTHTPGPWAQRPLALTVEGADGEPVANAVSGAWHRHTGSRVTRHRDEALANARLIAAAPALLRELERLADRMEQIVNEDGSTPCTAGARGAIALALEEKRYE
jgi:hypothetical protein